MPIVNEVDSAPVLYWDQVIAPQLESKPIAVVLEQLKKGEYSAAGLKKLSGYPYYTARINHDDRLLFTTYEYNGVRYLVLIEVILNHDYQKSRFLQSGVLEEYLEKNHQKIDKIIESSFKELTKEQLKDFSWATAKKNHFQPVIHYKKQFLSWDEQQEKLLKKTFPIFISGVPGSGKTLLAFQMILKHVKNNKNNGETLYYITRSKLLAHEMEQLWRTSPEVPETNCKVHFMSYAEWAAHCDPTIKNFKQIGEAAFLKTEQVLDHKLLYQEFRAICQHDPLENYLSSGVKSSLFVDINDKKKALKAFESYLNYLKENNWIDLHFYKIKVPESSLAALVVIDEVQDLTATQFSNACASAAYSQILACADTNQAVHEVMSNRPFALQCLQKQSKTPLEHVHLPYSHRLSKLAIELGNHILAARNKIMGGVGDKEEYCQMQLNPFDDPKAYLEWIDPRDQMHIEKLKELRGFCKNAKTAVFILDESQRLDAQKLFETEDNIYTISQGKGLEFHTVILYRPFQNEGFKKINRLLNEDVDAFKLNEHRTSQPEEKEYLPLVPLINGLFSAATRTQKGLSIYCENAHEHQNLLSWLKAFSSKNNVSRVVPEQSTEQEWLELANKLDMNENIEHANRIRQATQKRKQSSSSSSSTSSKTKATILVNKVINQFNKENLLKLLHSENARDNLMNIKGENNMTVFGMLHKKFLQCYLVLMGSEEFQPLLKELLMFDDAALIKTVPAKVLFSCKYDRPSLCNDTNPYFNTIIGQEIMELVVQHRQNVDKDMEYFAKGLLEEIVLCNDAEIRKGLYQFIKRYEYFFVLITNINLYEEKLFDCLCLDVAGVEIMEMIYNTKPHLLVSLPTEILMGKNRCGGENLNIVDLALHLKGMKILKHLFIVKIEHYSQLTVRVLASKNMRPGGSGVPLFGLFAGTTLGREIIYNMPESQRSLEVLPKDLIYGVRTISGDALHCPFCSLLSSNELVRFTHQRIYKKRPDLIDALPVDLFTTTMIAQLTGLRVAPIMVLSHLESGLELLKLFIERPGFIERMFTVQTLYLQIFRADVPKIHLHSPFASYLFNAPSILDKIYRVLPGLIPKITNSILFTPVFAGENEPLLAPFMWLLEEKSLHRHLMIMSQGKENFYSKISKAMLFEAQFSHKTKRQKEFVGFSSLVTTAQGCSLLNRIFNERPDLLDALPETLLLNDLTQMLLQEEGSSLLLNILQHRPALAAVIHNDKRFTSSATSVLNHSTVFGI